MSVVEFRSQLSFVERVFYSLFCNLVDNNYCGYPINIDKFIKKMDDIKELFIELEFALDIFSNENNFKTFLIRETHCKNKGFYNEEENKIFLLISEEEIEINKTESEDIEMLVNNLYHLLKSKKSKVKRLTIAS